MNIKRKKTIATMFKVVSTMALMASVANAQQEQFNADDIVKKAYEACYYAADDGARKARMTIVDKDGSKQLRQFNIFRKDKEDAGDQDFLVVFERPSDVKGTVFLVNKHIDGDDDRWLYLPGLDLDKRISASDKRTSFVGSNYFYEDISGRNYKLDNYELLEDNESFYLVKSMPKNKDLVEYEYSTLKIDKKNFMPQVISYYKAGDKLFRKAEILEVKNADGFATVFKSKISNFETGGYTLVQFKAPKYDQGLSDSLFGERSLRNPPKKVEQNK